MKYPDDATVTIEEWLVREIESMTAHPQEYCIRHDEFRWLQNAQGRHFDSTIRTRRGLTYIFASNRIADLIEKAQK